jgi:hypothetical protein
MNQNNIKEWLKYFSTSRTSGPDDVTLGGIIFFVLMSPVLIIGSLVDKILNIKLK